MKAPFPPNEQERLNNLQTYQILDSESDQNWNAIAQLAAFICETPISAITFIDRDRQWFKSIMGLEGTGTTRDQAFCAHTILHTEPLIVSDAHKDPRFQKNDLVLADPFIRFYAGAPITSAEGFELGALCVVDRQPRQLKPEQIAALQLLSRQVSALLILHKKNVELEQAKAKAEKLTQAKSDFIALLSHELRTPLNAILGYGELLREETLPTQAQKDVDKILGAGQHLLQLITNLLDLSKIEAGKMQIYLEAIPLKTLVIDVCTILEPLFKKNQNQFELHCAPACETCFWYTDAQKLTQILYNLLSNANKFTHQGHIRVEINLLPSHLEIAVQDTGVGIEDKHLKTLFQSFSQGDVLTTRNYGGTGLGLALSQEFAGLLGGKIEVQSKKNQGSTFRLILPALPPAGSTTS